MPNLMQQAAALALSAALALGGVSITYTQGGHTSAPLTAAVGTTEYEIEDAGVIVETWTARDYLLPATSLVVNSAVVLPGKGDVITEVINGHSHTFAVLAPAGKQVFEFSDRQQTWLRIHTKKVG